MSLEQKIEALTVSINKLIDVMDNSALPGSVRAELTGAPATLVHTNALSGGTVVTLVPPQPVHEMTPPLVTTQVNMNPPPVAAAPGMPAPPSFTAPAVQQPTVAAGAPFTDGKGLIDYVMNSYQQLGAVKGAAIQQVMTSLGYQNINDIRPEHYAALHQGVERLKAQP